MKRLALAIALIVPAALAGCTPAPPTIGPSRLTAAFQQVTPRTQWSVTGTLRDKELACDGRLDTVATAGQTPYLTIDLGKACYLNLVVVEHGGDEDAYARRVQITTSMDGKKFSEQIVGPGTRRVSNYLLRRPALARFVRIHAIQPGPKPWAVAEVHLQ